MQSSGQLAEHLSKPVDGSLGRRASRGVVWTTLQSLANRLSGVIVFLVLARLLAPAEFGLLAAALVFISLTTTFAEAGLTRTLVQRPVLRAAHLNAALLVNALAGLVLMLGLLVAAPWIADLYDMPQLSAVLSMLSVVPLLSGISAVPESILRRQFKFRSLALRSTGSVVTAGAIGIVAATLGAGVWALVSQVVAQAVLANVILWASVRWRPSPRTDREAVRELVGFGSHVLGISFLNFLNRRSAEFLIGVFLGPVALGLFTVAQRVHNMLMDMLVANVQSVALPVFSRVSDEPQRLASAYVRSTAVTTVAAFPAFALMALLGRELVPLAFGVQWTQAGPIMAILALAGPIQSIAYFNGSIMLAVGRSWLALKFTAANAVANVATFLVTVHFGVIAVAIGFTVRCWVMLPIGLLLVRWVSSVTLMDQVRSFLVPSAGVMAMVAVVVVSEALDRPHESVGWLVLTALLALGAYAGVVGMIRRDLAADLVVRIKGRLSPSVSVAEEVDKRRP